MSSFLWSGMESVCLSVCLSGLFPGVVTSRHHSVKMSKTLTYMWNFFSKALFKSDTRKRFIEEKVKRMLQHAILVLQLLLAHNVQKTPGIKFVSPLHQVVTITNPLHTVLPCLKRHFLERNLGVNVKLKAQFQKWPFKCILLERPFHPIKMIS